MNIGAHSALDFVPTRINALHIWMGRSPFSFRAYSNSLGDGGW